MSASKKIFLLVLFLTSFILIVGRWFAKGDLIISSDLTFPLKPLFYFTNKLVYQWLSDLNGGISHAVAPSLFIFHGVGSVLNLFLNDPRVIQDIHFVFWLFLPVITIFFLGKYLFRKEKYLLLLTFFFILFYSFNLYRVIMFGDAAHMSIYAAAPLVLLFTIKAFSEKKFLKYSFLIAFSSLIASGAGANPPMYAVFLIPPIFYIFFVLIESYFKKQFFEVLFFTLKFSFSTGLISFLLNSYWILPLIYQYFNLIKVKNLEEAGLFDWSLGTSAVTSITNIIRMQGAWDWYSGFGGDPYIPYAGNYQNNLILLFLGFLLPILAFSAVYFVRNRYTIFFTFITLIGIIFSQGAHPPFGPIYNFLTQHVPLFWMFRSSWYKFSFLVALGYSYLGAISATYIFSQLVKKKIEIFKLKFAYIFLFLVTCGTLIYAYPFINGEKFPKKGVRKILPASHVKVPDYVYKSADWINAQKEIFRTFAFPNMPAFIYKWDFNGLTDVTFYLYDKGELYTSDQVGTNNKTNSIGVINAQIYNAIYSDQFEKALKLSGLLSTKYLVERNDIRYDFYGGYESPKFVNQKLHGMLGDPRVFGEWNFYKLPENYFLPMVYPAKNVILANSQVDSLGDILDSSDFSRPLVLFPDSMNSDKKINSLAKSYVIKADCVLCSFSDHESLRSKIEIPFIQLLPNSVFYFLVTDRERKQLNQVANIPDVAINIRLKLANKRLRELSMISERSGIEEKDKIIEETIRRYKILMNEAILSAENMQGIGKNRKLIEILANLDVQDSFLGSINKLNENAKVNLSYFIDDARKKILDEVWQTDQDNRKRLIFNIEKEGDYKISIAKSAFNPSEISIDGKKLKDPQEVRLETGVHRMEIIYPSFEDAIIPDDKEIDFELMRGGEKGFFINNFDYKNNYQIEFQYRISKGQDINFQVVQDNDQIDWNGNPSRRIKYNLKSDSKWHKWRGMFNPNLGAKNARLEFSYFGFGSSAEISLKNFTVKPSFSPNVYLIKMESAPVDNKYPDISFLRINPTRYLIYVNNATKPYVLNFGENYDKGWRAHIIDNQEINKNQKIQSTIARYFGDSIKEIFSENKFLDDSLLLTLFGKHIDERYHFKTNGYANGWLIDKTGNYAIIIEYYPQKVFYLGILLSITGIIFAFTYLLLRIKNEKN